MSFDLFLNSFSNGQPAPADREAAEQFLTENNVRSEAGRLSGQDAEGNEIFGFVQWRDGQEWTGGAQLIIRSLNQSITDFAYGFAAAGRLAICNPQFELPEPMWLLPPSVSVKDLPEGDRQQQPALVVNSGLELAQGLVQDFTSFDAIQKAVVDLFGESEPPDAGSPQRTD